MWWPSGRPPQRLTPTACFHGEHGPCWGDGTPRAHIAQPASAVYTNQARGHGAPEVCARGACTPLPDATVPWGQRTWGDHLCPVFKDPATPTASPGVRKACVRVVHSGNRSDPGGFRAEHVVLPPRACRARHVTPRKADRQLRSGGTGSPCPSCDPSVGHQGLTEVGSPCPPPLGVSVSVLESLGDGPGRCRAGSPVVPSRGSAGRLRFCFRRGGSVWFASSSPHPSRLSTAGAVTPPRGRARAHGGCSVQPGSPFTGEFV